MAEEMVDAGGEHQRQGNGSAPGDGSQCFLQSPKGLNKAISHLKKEQPCGDSATLKRFTVKSMGKGKLMFIGCLLYA